MNANIRIAILLVCAPLVITGCSFFGFGERSEKPQTPAATPNNPSYAHCVTTGGTYEERKGSGGSKVGYCVFADGTECEAWAFYHALCTQKNGSQKPEPTTSETTPPQKPEPQKPEPQVSADTSVQSSGVVSLITITSPAQSAQLSSPVEISGTASVPDGKLTVAFTNLSGKEIFSVPISVRDGKFKGTVSYEFSATKEGYIVVYSGEHVSKVHVKF